MNLRNVSLVLKKKIVLNNINLHISSNDKIGIIGPNGAGKTVLLRLLAGIYKDYKGKIDSKIDYFFLSKPGIGALPDQILVPNIKRILAFHNISRINNHELFKLIDEFGLEKYSNYEFKNLSSGFKLRLSIVVFFLIKSEYILLDEFFGFGDDFIMNKFSERLENKIRNIKGLIVASHNKKLISRFCNRILYFENGFIIKDERL